MPGFQLLYRFLHHFVLTKLPTSSIRVEGFFVSYYTEEASLLLSYIFIFSCLADSHVCNSSEARIFAITSLISASQSPNTLEPMGSPAVPPDLVSDLTLRHTPSRSVSCLKSETILYMINKKIKICQLVKFLQEIDTRKFKEFIDHLTTSLTHSCLERVLARILEMTVHNSNSKISALPDLAT